MTNYRDYLWVEEFEFFTSDGYCLALVDASTTGDILTSLRTSDDRLSVVGAKAALRESHSLGVQHDVDGVRVQPVAIAEVANGWTMLLQAPGFLGISDTAMAEIIMTHNVVSHGADRFVWWSGGVKKTSFEPLLPQADLAGVLADRQPPESRAHIVALIAEVGGIDLDETPGREFHHVAGSFALAERLTGVRITNNLLETSPFTVTNVTIE
ncbi:hypothetical protein BH93_27135 (plasmid) [Rhodococcoides fascians A25f]|uniref:DUF6461 domain-containing protein n=1 Tax=Rhodococcoides fascians TaxID=1828 RepID=UPI000560987C|nr:DUF6461 domain-containing protein [Rhodococcus fascians]QII09251.1 hypothetical protein BH93_27135 [Rhodococcus fascians A25f]